MGLWLEPSKASTVENASVLSVGVRAIDSGRDLSQPTSLGGCSLLFLIENRLSLSFWPLSLPFGNSYIRSTLSLFSIFVVVARLSFLSVTRLSSSAPTFVYLLCSHLFEISFPSLYIIQATDIALIRP
jgi:hypothetical protein